MKILEAKTTGGDTIGIVVDKIDAIIDKEKHTDIHLTGYIGVISIEEPYDGVITALRDGSSWLYIPPNREEVELKDCDHFTRVFNRALNIIECSDCGKIIGGLDMAEERN